MSRFKITIQYDGTGFRGWQLQKSDRTVQGELESALKKMNKNELIRVHGAGRTDTGVHATGQVAHFDFSTEMDSCELKDALNGNTPRDIKILTCVVVPEAFHARFSAKQRIYTYIIFNRISRPSIEKNRGWHIRKKLDLKLMKKGAKKLLGTNDFSTFRSSSCNAKSPIRTMKSIKIKEVKNKIQIQFKSQSFLQQQVRSMVGCLKQVAEKRWSLKRFEKVFKLKKRSLCAAPAPAHGLFLEKVIY